MLQKLNKSTRGGFTLVEIMIVVAIIALLAAIAVPNFLRARKRSQATSTLETLRQIDGAIDQYAIETNKPPAFPVGKNDLIPYVKKDSVLYTQLVGAGPQDNLTRAIAIPAVDTPPTLDAATYTDLADVLGDQSSQDAFWGAYKAPTP